MNYSVEVLVYLQKLKNHIINNDDARDYFFQGTNGEDFYRIFLDVADKNFKRTGIPDLTQEQFEFLRKTLKIFNQSDKQKDLIFTYHTNKFKFHLK